MADKNWKRHERAVARHFGVERNVHGRGEEGHTNTDVVVDIGTWAEGIPEYQLSATGIATHFFVECKYTHTTKHPLYKHLEEAKHMNNKGPIPLCYIGQFLCCYLSDFEGLYRDFGIDGNVGFHPAKLMMLYSVFHARRSTPGYMYEWQQQVERDIKARDKTEIPTAMPLVCLGSSKKSRIIMYDISSEWRTF